MKTKTARKPLDLPNSRWHSRWLYFVSRNAEPVLHRVSEIRWGEGMGDDPRDMIRGPGVTLCGRRGFLHMPGVEGRLGLPRCRKCCELAGVPEGDGAPWNAAEKGAEWRGR